jgi:hypothetical protein
LNNEFTAESQYASNAAGFFSPNLQLPYPLNYGPNVTQTDPPILQTLQSMPENEGNDPEDSVNLFEMSYYFCEI